MTDAELIELSDLCFAESLREGARWCAVGEASEAGGLLCVASATRLPAGPFNAVIGVGEAAAGEDVLERARSWFGARARGFTVYVRDSREAGLAERCRAAGLTSLGVMPGMVLEAPPAALPAGVTEVVDAAGLQTFVDVSVPAWEAAGLGGAALRKHFAEPRRLHVPHVGVVVARDSEGRPAATALALLSHGVAGLYWVGTIPAARGRGLGAAVTAAASRWAFERGARAVFLQASAQGEPVYLRMGFREITRYPWLVAAAAHASAP